jgi:hypothetical protein
MRNEHVSESPYLITVDKKSENVTGQLSNGMPIARDVSKIRKEGRKPTVLLRIVDFVTEKMLLTQDGKLKKLPSGNMITTSRIPKQVAVEISGHKVENGNISDIDTNKRAESSITISSPISDINLAIPQRHKLKRRDLDFFRDRCKKIMLLCRFFVKRNPSHNSFQILHSAEQFLDGRPVRLTDKTFKLIENGLKSIKQQTDEYNRDENRETKISDSDVLKTERNLGNSRLADKCEQMLMTCECITIFPHKPMENRSHVPIEMMNFSKINPVEPNLSRVQHKEEIRDMRLNTEITVGDNSGYDLNCRESSTICYDVDHSPKHEVCDANNPNEGTEGNGTKAKNVFSSSRGAQNAKIWDEGLNMGTPSQKISTSLIPFTKQNMNLKLETMLTLKFPDKRTQKEHAVLIPETADIKVTAHELWVDQMNCFIFTPLYFGVCQQDIIILVPERQCLTEKENRRNAIVCDVLTSIDHEVPFSSVCKQGVTLISAKKGMGITSYLPSSFVPELHNFQGNKNETNVRLNYVLRTENVNETINYLICHITASASATGIEYENTECKTSTCAGRNFESKEICSMRDTRRYLQSAKHPAQVTSICKHSELQTEDEASYKKCWEGKNNESSINIIWSTENDSLKVTEIFMNEDDETNHTNSQAGQTIGTELTDMSSNINIPVTETDYDDTVFGRHIRHKPAEDLETDGLVNITCSSRRTNNRNVCTLLPHMLQEPHEGISLQLDTAFEQTGATCTSLLTLNTFDYKRRVKHALAQVKNRRELLAQNTEYSSNYTYYVLPDIVMQPTAAPGANILLQKNKTNILDPFTSHDYIPEVSKSIRLEPINVGANSSVDKNKKISESQTEQSPSAAFVNTVDVKGVSNSYSECKIAENNITHKSSLLLLGFLTPMRENTLHAPAQPSDRVKERDNNVTASSVSNMLYNAENGDVKFHGQNGDPNRSRRIASRRLQRFSDVGSKVVSITSNEKHVVNEQKHLSETEKSYTKLGGLTNQKIHELCNNVFPSHIDRRISSSLLPNMNINFRGSSEMFQENETVNIHKRVLTSQKRNERPVGKPETKLSLTKCSALQCEQFMFSSTCNKNEISSLEEWTITARLPVTHSSQTDRVAYSMPQTAGDTSSAISLPQLGVITTDMDILHPLVTKKTDPKGSIGEARHDNKLSNKINENFDSTAKKVLESKERVVCGTEYLKSQVPIRNDVRIQNQNVHQVVATKYYTNSGHKRKDNYVRRREIETKIPEIFNTNIYTLVTYENSLNDECVNNDCKWIDPENERFKKSMEYKIPDKMQNDVAITELKTTQDMRNYFMKHRPNVQDLLISNSINRSPDCMQVTREKEYLDKKWMKQSEWQDKQQVQRNDIYDYNKYQQCFTYNMNHWSTNRRLTPVYKTAEVNTRKQAFASPITCNKNAVVECRMYGSDLARRQKRTNKYLMYKNINMSRQELMKISGLMRTGRIKLEGKCNIYINQKDIVLDVDDGGFISVGKFQNRQVFEHYIQIYRYSPAVISANFTPTTSTVLSTNTALYKQPQTDFDDKVDSYYRTANNSLQNEQQIEELTNGTANKQLQIMEEEDTSTVPMKTENCDLNKTKFEELVGTENDIYRAKLVHITDDGCIVPTLQTLLLTPSENNSINRKSFQGGSQNRTGFSPEQYGDEGSVYINHDNSDLHQLVYSKEAETNYRGLMSKKAVGTESRLRFQRAKLFFQKFQQNTSEQTTNFGHQMIPENKKQP